MDYRPWSVLWLVLLAACPLAPLRPAPDAGAGPGGPGGPGDPPDPSGPGDDPRETTTQEICGNGIDDDEDGVVDQGCGACEPGTAEACFVGPPALAGIGGCWFGKRDCGDDGSWGPCEGYGAPVAEACDGDDDDCDGAIDQGCACDPGGTRGCYTGPPDTEGVGICRSGAQRCGADGFWGGCGEDVLPQNELCDGVDNDCDGLLDEGCECEPGTVQPCYEGPADTRWRGSCLDGVERCERGFMDVGTGWSACEGWQGPAAEACDGLDNDCNGWIDEGCECAPGSSRACYSGPPGTDQRGSCRGGQQSCEGGGGWGWCEGERLPEIEVCNGADDDCDGETDEGACAVDMPPVARCPGDVDTSPFTEVLLEGGGDDPDGGTLQYQWDSVSVPAGSAVFVTGDDGASLRFTPDLVGLYVLSLTVTDEDGDRATCQTSVRAHGLGLRIHLYWNPPDRSCDRHPGDRCDDSDVDLHLLRPEANAWFDNAGDCHYANCRQGLSWDAAGSEDDPRMDIDDTEGHGPENINIDRPVEGNTYRVGVHYYDQARWGDSDAYVSVFCGDISINPVITYGPVTLRNGGAQNGDFWRVADVRWDGALGCTVFDIDPWGADLDTAADARAQR